MLLGEAQAAGLSVRAEGDRLVIRGPKEAEPVARLLLERKAMVLAALAEKPRGRRLYSRLLGVEFWIVETEAAAAELETDVAREGDRRPVLTVLELAHLADLARSDLAEAARTLLEIKRVLPGARLRSFGAVSLDA